VAVAPPGGRSRIDRLHCSDPYLHRDHDDSGGSGTIALAASQSASGFTILEDQHIAKASTTVTANIIAFHV
jgi:hypothetical protein